MAEYGTADDWNSEFVFNDRTLTTADAKLLDGYPIYLEWLSPLLLLSGLSARIIGVVWSMAKDAHTRHILEFCLRILRLSRVCVRVVIAPYVAFFFSMTSLKSRWLWIEGHGGFSPWVSWKIVWTNIWTTFDPSVTRLVDANLIYEIHKSGRQVYESDVSYKPIFRTLDTKWPSIIVEVGVSESLGML